MGLETAWCTAAAGGTKTKERGLKRIPRNDVRSFMYDFLNCDVTVTFMDLTVKSRHPSIRDLNGHHLVTLEH